MEHAYNTDSLISFETIIRNAYKEYQPNILSYIANRINHRYDAEDLTQDVFMRLLEYKQMIRPETVKYFLYTIARNIVTDHIRRYYKRQEMDAYMYDTMAYSINSTEEDCQVADILSLEQKKLKTLAPQRRTVYYLNRFEGKSVDEISRKMFLIRKTVENHLLLGRKEIRNYIRKCI
ncbi:MAG: sigma-70 family RNA polymerase sigma factor [Tannerella sp.]|jgi:RNA polymerase sigma-70 factor (ECF subfamily)|nr:sigma-70 family RNA polymerase sigma factor [Tannerella sp.]